MASVVSSIPYDETNLCRKFTPTYTEQYIQFAWRGTWPVWVQFIHDCKSVKDREVKPIRDDFGVTIYTPSAEQAVPRQMAEEAMKWVLDGSSEGVQLFRARQQCILVIFSLLSRAGLPLLNIGSFIEEWAPEMVQFIKSKCINEYSALVLPPSLELPHPLSLAEFRGYFHVLLQQEIHGRPEKSSNTNSAAGAHSAAETDDDCSPEDADGLQQLRTVGWSQEAEDALNARFLQSRDGQETKRQFLEDVWEIVWCLLLAIALIPPPDIAHSSLVGCYTNTPLPFTYIVGLMLSRHKKKRASYTTAVAAHIVAGFKRFSSPKIVLRSILDLFAGLGPQRWELCADDTHNIYPLTLLAIAVNGIAHVSKFREILNEFEGTRKYPYDTETRLLILYVQRYGPQSCLYDWASKICITNPKDRGVGDLDVTPLCTAIVFSIAWLKRLQCPATEFNQCPATEFNECPATEFNQRENEGGSPDPPTLSRSPDAKRDEYGLRPSFSLCPSHMKRAIKFTDIMASVYSVEFQFTALLRVIAVFVEQRKSDKSTEYLGHQWTAGLAGVHLFRLACRYVNPPRESSPLYNNIHKFTIPLPQLLSSIILCLSDSVAEQSIARNHQAEVTKYMRQFLMSFDDKNSMKLFESIMDNINAACVNEMNTRTSCMAYCVDEVSNWYVKKGKNGADTIPWLRQILKAILQQIIDDPACVYLFDLIQACVLLIQRTNNQLKDLNSKLTEIARKIDLEKSAHEDNPAAMQKINMILWHIDEAI